MFPNQEETKVQTNVPAPVIQTRLREELRERLRLVADFATLGAYTDEEPTAREAHEDAPHARGGELTRRVFLFARAPIAQCPHSPEAADPCPTRAVSRIPRPARSSLGRRLPRRRGGVAPSTQPCLCAPAEPVAGRPAR